MCVEIVKVLESDTCYGKTSNSHWEDSLLYSLLILFGHAGTMMWNDLGLIGGQIDYSDIGVFSEPLECINEVKNVIVKFNFNVLTKKKVCRKGLKQTLSNIAPVIYKCYVKENKFIAINHEFRAFTAAAFNISEHKPSDRTDTNFTSPHTIASSLK